MKDITIKSGTRAEIIEYVRKKITKTITITDGDFGEGKKWSDNPNEGDVIEFSHNTVENQIDERIRDGCPIVGISLMRYCGESYRDTFIIEDYSSIRADMEIERMDNPELRQRRIDAIKQVMNMELEAEERWNRILKIVDEFNGVSIPFNPSNIL